MVESLDLIVSRNCLQLSSGELADIFADICGLVQSHLPDFNREDDSDADNHAVKDHRPFHGLKFAGCLQPPDLTEKHIETFAGLLDELIEQIALVRDVDGSHAERLGGVDEFGDIPLVFCGLM